MVTVVPVRMASGRARRGGGIWTSSSVRACADNVSVDTPLAQTGACARIHLPSGWICELPDRHHGSCEFLHPEDIADAKKGFLDAWTGTWPQRT